MDFFSSGLWWGLFIGASVSSTVSFAAYKLGRAGLWQNVLGGFGGLLTLLFGILAFIFTGWQGGLAVFVGVIPVIVVGALAIWLILSGRTKQ